MEKMYNCKSAYLCKKCQRITKNCAECKHSVEKTNQCLNGGILSCKYFKEVM